MRKILLCLFLGGGSLYSQFEYAEVLGSVRDETSIGRSRYDGMNLTYRQRNFHKTDLMMNYTLARAVIDPRGVLAEFGVTLADDIEVRVWDSTAELRYLVMPERPAGSEQMSEEALAALVTRDAMIGVAKAALPQKGARL